ncbi:MAG TPA: TetR/AcrR family transcriptional regulator [Chthoniobacterales bacterium]
MRASATRSPEETRRQILEAAFVEFYRNGFQGGSINRIVKEASATKGALFHHFKSKNDLGYAVAREVIHPRLKTRWTDPLAESDDPIRDLKRIFRKCLKEEMDNGQLVQGCPLNNLALEMSPLDERFRKTLEKIYGSWRESLAAAFSRGIKAGKVRKGVSPEKVAAFIVAAQAGMIGTAKNAQCTTLLGRTREALFDYLDSLKP